MVLVAQYPIRLPSCKISLLTGTVEKKQVQSTLTYEVPDQDPVIKY